MAGTPGVMAARGEDFTTSPVWHGTNNGNDIETKRSETSIIGVFSISKRNELTYSRTGKDRSEANTIIIVHCRIEAITNIISPEFAGSKRKRK